MVGSRFGRARLIFARFGSAKMSIASHAPVTGGKLTIQDGVIRNNVANDGVNDNTPTIILTGGELELTPRHISHLLADEYEPWARTLIPSQGRCFRPTWVRFPISRPTSV